MPYPELFGLYHVAAKPINKYELLCLISEVYEKKIKIMPHNEPVLDRSLCADRFRLATGYIAPDWPLLIRNMHQIYQQGYSHKHSMDALC